jgi:hypothetical protein
MSDPVFPVINLPNAVEIQQAANSSQIEILQTTDDPVGKTVKSLVKVSTNPYAHNWYTVWQGDAYDQAGQWTDAQLSAAIVTLVTGEYPPALSRA